MSMRSLVVPVNRCPGGGRSATSGVADPGQDWGDDLIAQGQQGGDGAEAGPGIW